MAKFERKITGIFEEVVSHLENEVRNSGLSMNLVDESDFTIEETKIAVRVYDKYFMRNSSRASLSLTIVGNSDEIYISAIGAGGGHGAIFNFSLGAESDMVAIVEQSLKKLNA
ncbi:DUF6054 family protein [Oceanobacillus sp. CAU 1775]